MNRGKILLTVLLLAAGTAGFCAQKVNQLPPVTNFNAMSADFEQSDASKDKNKSNSQLDTNTVYYPNANLNSAVSKYKNANYTGCLQELFSLVKKQPNNSKAYYYMAMAYANIGMQTEAVQAYEKVMELSPNSYLAEFAERGKDCLTGGPLCHPEAAKTAGEGENSESTDALDEFINAPYGNGLSPELNKELKERKLKNIQKQINEHKDLDVNDIEKIREFDKGNTEHLNESHLDETIKIAQVSDEEVLNAVKTLKDAGLNVTVSANPYNSAYSDPQMAQLSMMLGNNNNNGSMMNMMPMLMAQNQEGKNIDPRLIQAMMMNSMMTDFTFSDNKDRY